MSSIGSWSRRGAADRDNRRPRPPSLSFDDELRMLEVPYDPYKFAEIGRDP
jgi:hypothetical protein